MKSILKYSCDTCNLKIKENKTGTTITKPEVQIDKRKSLIVIFDDPL